MSMRRAGNLVEKTDRLGRVTQLVYDNLYRLREEKWLVEEAVVRTFAYTYDAAGQLTQATDVTSTYGYAYDGLGRVISESQSFAGFLHLIQYSRQFNAAGRVTTLSAAGGFLKQQNELRNATFVQWSSYGELAREIARVSREGRTPIRKLIVAFHWYGGDPPENDSVQAFLDAGTVQTLYHNTFENAKARKGPLRSWFTRNAEVIGLGCNCSGVAQFMANNLLREGATALGTLAFVHARGSTNPPVFVAGFDMDGNGLFDPVTEGHQTLVGLMGVQGKWQSYEGTR